MPLIRINAQVTTEKAINTSKVPSTINPDVISGPTGGALATDDATLAAAGAKSVATDCAPVTAPAMGAWVAACEISAAAVVGSAINKPQSYNLKLIGTVTQPSIGVLPRVAGANDHFLTVLTASSSNTFCPLVLSTATLSG